MKKIMALLAGTALMLATSGAMATPIIPQLGGEYPNLQQVVNNITVGPVAGHSHVNVQTDYLADGLDANWHITASGGSVATMIIQVAGLASQSTFGVYDLGNPINKVALFSGAQKAGNQALLSILDDGTVEINFIDKTVFSGTNFGYYLTAGSNTWYSDTKLNSDNFDHMLAYQGKGVDTVKIGKRAAGVWEDNEYLLAFEDLPFGASDLDYQDFVAMVESVNPVPEPSTLLLLGAGLAGLGFFGRRRAKK